ncbi:hypothetical protein HN588_00470 [Candidatus Bathyarchaeota archaeon]|jgi:hypothetical protein|nr:hypothetical protein [Candidatus Bathyarchaeota archaeon]
MKLIQEKAHLYLSNLTSFIYRFRYLLGSSLVFALVFGIGYISYRPAIIPRIAQVSHPTGTVKLTLSPSTLNTNPNSTQVITLTADSGGSNVSAIQAELEYDPTTLTVNSVTQGDFLANSLSTAKIENGRVKFAYAAPPDSGGINGSGTLATISITTSSTNSRLSFTTETQAATTQSKTNALLSAIDANIVVDPESPDSPIPSSSPTPQSSPTVASINSTSTQETPDYPDSQNSDYNYDDDYTTSSPTGYEQPGSPLQSESNTPTIQDLDTPTEQPNILQKAFIGWKIIMNKLLQIIQ